MLISQVSHSKGTFDDLEKRDDGIDDVVAIIDHRDEPPFVEGGAGVGNPTRDPVSDLEVSAIHRKASLMVELRSMLHQHFTPIARSGVGYLVVKVLTALETPSFAPVAPLDSTV